MIPSQHSPARQHQCGSDLPVANVIGTSARGAHLAIAGGYPIRLDPFPAWPIWDRREEQAVLEVLRSGAWGHTMKPDDRTRKFEHAFADYTGAGYCITVANGSVAIEAALRAADVGYGDEVITTPTTFVSTGMAAVMVGADPVFVDILPDTYCIDPSRIEAAITGETKAVIVVHIGGNPCEMNAIMDIARRHGLVVIEDCAQAHGSCYEERHVGTFGDFGCFSFEQSKLMTAGEGGAIITNNEDYADAVFGLCNAGFKYGNRAGWDKAGKVAAWNLRITEFQAAILTCQLSRLDEHKRIRQANARYLTDKLSQLDGIDVMTHAKDQNY